MNRAPALFVSHGAPSLALETDGAFARALAGFCRDLSPRALVVFSGHDQAPRPIRITAGERPGLVYDFGGFPDELYKLTYPAPGSPAVSREIAALLDKAGLPSALDEKAGWDHGLWVPLRLAFPSASVPVVEVSLPRGAAPAELLRIGAALCELRESGVVLIGSGGIVHNLRLARLDAPEGPVDDWAAEFDAWVADRLAKMEIAELVSYRTRAPHADLAVPTTEHFDPLFVVLGGAAEDDRLLPVYEGFQYGNLSLRSFALG
ncbi:MAG: class III extradiol ring-cleavage dioxygenase [Acidobacteriota bacterium]